eukprot:jgi/Chlat1/3638/Chrsp238S03628
MAVMAGAALRVGGVSSVNVECYKYKSTKKHEKMRPRKHNPADKRHGPAVYPNLQNLPTPPPEYTVIEKTSPSS